MPRTLGDEARSWIGDCQWGDLETEDVCSLTDDAAFAGVDRHYQGGFDAFKRDGHGGEEG